MHQAALLRSEVSDATAFGWSVGSGSTITHDWPAMVAAIQTHIAGLNSKNVSKVSGFFHQFNITTFLAHF